MTAHPLQPSEREGAARVAPHETDRGRPLLRHSLRLRLPLLFGVLVVVMLATFLWGMHRVVEDTLVGEGERRAQLAADELAGTLSRSIAAVIGQQKEWGLDSSVLAVLQEPNDRNRSEAGRTLLPSPERGMQRIELWNASGALVLELAAASTDSTADLSAYPPGEAPAGPRVSNLRVAHGVPYFDMTVAVRNRTTDGAPVHGYIRRFGRLTASANSLVTNLLGEDAVLRVGSWDSSVWTDMVSRSPPAPGPDSAGGPGAYRAPDGAHWIGASAGIVGTPWIVWVGYPRATVTAPLQVFMRRMLIGGLLFVAAGTLFGGALSLRITRPLHALAGAAEEIAQGDYSRRVSIDRRDEIGRLSTAFNTMSARVEEAHQTLTDVNQLTQFALAAAQIGVWESQLAFGSLTCSDSMALVHGVDVNKLPGTCAALLQLVHEDDRVAVRHMLEGRLRPEGVFDVEYRALWPDGSLHWIEGKGRVKLDVDGTPVAVLGVSIDVTERQRLEAQLRQSQKMEAVGQLAGGVAHDFNNLLTAIVGHGNMLRADVGAQDAAQEDVDAILHAADSAARLTRQLLTFSRQSVTQPEVVSLNDVLMQTEKLLRRLIPEHIAVVTAQAPDLPPVRIDVSHLEQIIVNLVVNARDAMPNGGELRISTSREEVDGSAAFVDDTVEPGTYAALTVIDTGTGMDAKTRAHLFEPFFTTKPAGQGTGLGLATVFGIVRESRGHITVTSSPGEGSQFTILLPASARQLASTPPHQSDVRPARGHETILVVEDDRAVCGIARRILERQGYRVETAASGEEALLLLAMRDTPPDLVLTDVVMPGMSGAELFREMTAQHPGLRVLFTSGYAADRLEQLGVELAKATFIEKPYTPAALAAKVRAALGSDAA